MILIDENFVFGVEIVDWRIILIGVMSAAGV